MSATGFLDLNRRFRDLRDTDLDYGELDDPGILALLDDGDLGLTFGWNELLEHPRVVLLAEAGAGKSSEMSEQAKRLVKEGCCAFFVPIEFLASEPLTSLLDPCEEKKFNTWKTGGNEPGWFFLDSVDELKLINGKLDRALQRFSKDIDGHLDRARVFISCRPSDWFPDRDLKTVRDRLSAPDEPASNDVWTVAMLPMDNGRIMAFAKHRGASDTGAFLEEIERENAWDFARRPFDLANMVANWRLSGRLGTREEQHETNATAKLRDDPERPDHDKLTDNNARTGAETLALGLALTRTRTIGSPERPLEASPAEGVLRANDILPGWNEAQRQTLLRRALFGPATYGRIRFHHRSVQEYLAACRLRNLHDRGMSRTTLSWLLFAEVYGTKIVRPSMRAIAAWLALWNSDVRKELIEREPEVLLSFGDPSVLEREVRARLLRALITEYGHGGWRGLDIPIEAVRRLSHPELADVVRECWGSGPSNVDVWKLLIEMIRQGRIEECADLARNTAFDAGCDPDCRIAAVSALLACGLDKTVRECVDVMLSDAASWPDEVVCHVAADLFPRIVTAEELAMLMETRHEEADKLRGFKWESSRIARIVEPRSEPAIALRKKMADLIFRTRDPPEPYRMRSKFSYLAPALAMLCGRQLSDLEGELPPGLIDACVIASRFGADETDVDNAVGKLREMFESELSMRSTAFWAEQAFVDKLTPASYDSNHYYCTAHDNLIGPLTEADWPWLEIALGDDNRQERRSVALHRLINLWWQHGCNSSELDSIRDLVKDDADLLQALPDRTTPPPEDDENQRKLAKSEREHPLSQKAPAAQEDKQSDESQTWREWLVDNPGEAFSAENVDETLSKIHLWLLVQKQDRGRRNTWDKNLLKQEFGPGVAEHAEAAFRAFWRKKPPMLWSERPAGKKNIIPQHWIMGLVGVSAEASHPGWAKNLPPEDVRTATAYATMESSGLAPFIVDLAEAHPSEVEKIIGGEVSAELAVGSECEHLPTLQNLGHADASLKQLFVPRLLEELMSMESAPKWLHHHERILRVLTEAGRTEDREAIARECLKRYEADPGGPLAIAWLRGLFQFDPRCGTRVLTGALGDADDAEASARAVETFAALFGGHDRVVPEVQNPAERAQIFGELVRSAYACVRWEDDGVHKDAYSFDTRNDAQKARSFLLSELLETPGPEAHRVVLELAGEKDFEHFSDRLRLLARRKAATDGELEPFEPADIVALEDKLEASAKDAEGLFSVMMDRLNDWAHDLRHHEFSDRITVQGIEKESEMRRTLAMRLEAKANGVYKVAQEEEVVDGKRTDIRLLAVEGSHKTVIEIKVLDNGWTLKELEKAIEDQLVGQYLRHDNCKSGCLLLTHAGRKKHWEHPETGKRLSPPEVIEFLREKAAEIEKETLHDVRVDVFLLDLTDPIP